MVNKYNRLVDDLDYLVEDDCTFGIDQYNRLLSYIKESYEILEQIHNDATGDVNDSEKRIWPIRSKLHRKIYKILEINKDKNESEI
jgi:hypothetical protein